MAELASAGIEQLFTLWEPKAEVVL
jgi:hypothetical protein